MKLFSLISFTLLLVPTSAFSSDLLTGLTGEEVQQLQRGAMVTRTEDIAGKAWPRITVYRAVAATPAEVLAIFTDYNSAASFVPNVRHSKVLKEIHPWEKDVQYQLAVPLLPNESYVARNKLARKGKLLEVSWKAGEAKYFYSSVGNVQLGAFGNGSLIRYTNLVEPRSKMAGILRRMAQKQIEDTVKALAAEVARMKKRDPDALRKKTEELQKLLATLP